MQEMYTRKPEEQQAGSRLGVQERFFNCRLPYNMLTDGSMGIILLQSAKDKVILNVGFTVMFRKTLEIFSH
jgi:hypothetical protein